MFGPLTLSRKVNHKLTLKHVGYILSAHLCVNFEKKPGVKVEMFQTK